MRGVADRSGIEDSSDERGTSDPRAPAGVSAGVKTPSIGSIPNTDEWCRGRDSNPYKVALTSPSS